MTDQASSSITITASPADIMAVINDLESYPEWAGNIKKIEVLSRDAEGRPEEAHWMVDAGIIKAEYTLRYSYDGDKQVSWTLVKGSMKQNEGSYTMADKGDGTTDVTYSLAVDLGVPMLGMFKRKAEKVIMDTALKDLKKRVER